MSTSTSLDNVFDFLQVAEKQGFLNSNTVQARRTACTKLFSVLDDANQRTVEYVSENLEVIKRRFQHLNNDVRGQTVDEYGRRVSIVLSDFQKWSTDRSNWEREIVSRGARSNGDGEKRARSEKPKEKEKVSTAPPRSEPETDPNARIVKVPLKSGFEAEVKVPRDLTTAYLRRVLWAMLPYAQDWDPDVSPQQAFQLLESSDSRMRQ